MLKKLVFPLLISLFFCAAALADYTPVEPDYPVPEYVTQLLTVAGEEVGYAEDKRGYTKYGEWIGEPYTQWCAELLCWCVDQVDQRYGTQLLNNIYPMYSGQNTGRDWFIKQGRYVPRQGYLDGWGYQWYKGSEDYLRNGSYIPQPGDWVFFTWTNDDDTDHVAMVEYASVDEKGVYYIHVIEGNAPDRVQRTVYPIKDDTILGYGTVHDCTDWTMRGGNTGKKVSDLQAKLVALGCLDPQYATGTYGPSTTRAVKTLQQKHKLKTQNGRATIQFQYLLDELYTAAFPTEAEQVQPETAQTTEVQ